MDTGSDFVLDTPQATKQCACGTVINWWNRSGKCSKCFHRTYRYKDNTLPQKTDSDIWRLEAPRSLRVIPDYRTGTVTRLNKRQYEASLKPKKEQT